MIIFYCYIYDAYALFFVLKLYSKLLHVYVYIQMRYVRTFVYMIICMYVQWWQKESGPLY